MERPHDKQTEEQTIMDGESMDIHKDRWVDWQIYKQTYRQGGKTENRKRMRSMGSIRVKPVKRGQSRSNGIK